LTKIVNALAYICQGACVVWQNGLVTDDEAMTLTVRLLAAANALVDGIQAGGAARGFTDVRPAYGFAFTLLSAGGATITELAAHLGVTRQAAAQLVDEMVAREYVERQPHPGDGRAQLIVLTERGWACTRAASAAAADTVREWAAILGAAELRRLSSDLAKLASPERLRPTW
jgi:DNA-binding MarR family transcriptional regulator